MPGLCLDSIIVHVRRPACQDQGDQGAQDGAVQVLRRAAAALGLKNDGEVRAGLKRKGRWSALSAHRMLLQLAGGVRAVRKLMGPRQDTQLAPLSRSDALSRALQGACQMFVCTSDRRFIVELGFCWHMECYRSTLRECRCLNSSGPMVAMFFQVVRTTGPQTSILIGNIHSTVFQYRH